MYVDVRKIIWSEDNNVLFLEIYGANCKYTTVRLFKSRDKTGNQVWAIFYFP